MALVDRHLRLISGVIGCGAYLAGGWLLVGNLVARGGNSVPPAQSSALVGRGEQMPVQRVITLHVVDGPTWYCDMNFGLEATDELLVHAGDVAEVRKGLGCNLLTE